VIDSRIFLIIALILFSTKIFSIAMKRFHLPQVVGALAAGILLGPAVFGFVQPDNEVIAVLAEIGVVLLLFSAGMETDFTQLKSCAKASIMISVIGVTLSLGGGFALALLFGNGTFESFFIGVVIAAMSTSITVEALREMGKLKTKAGTAIMGAALVEDILIIVVLAVILGTGGESFNLVEVGFILLEILGFFIFAVLAGFLVNRLFNFMTARFGMKRRLSVFAIAFCFLMAWLAETFGLADITGAYIAGIAFCNTRCENYIESKTKPLSFMLFTPIFLAYIGFNTNFHDFTGDMVLFTVLLAAVAIVFKVAGSGFGAKICGFSNRESMQVGVGMIARGEISFIVAGKGIAASFICATLFPSIIAVVLVTVLITPLLLKAAFSDKKAKQKQPPP
jgi:Kef-type K+ transport system membrane component KefB